MLYSGCGLMLYSGCGLMSARLRRISTSLNLQVINAAQDATHCLGARVQDWHVFMLLPTRTHRSFQQSCSQIYQIPLCRAASIPPSQGKTWYLSLLDSIMFLSGAL